MAEPAQCGPDRGTSNGILVNQLLERLPTIKRTVKSRDRNQLARNVGRCEECPQPPPHHHQKKLVTVVVRLGAVTHCFPYISQWPRKSPAGVTEPELFLGL